MINQGEDPKIVVTNGDIRKDMLVEWVMSRVERWRRHRDQNYATRWAEYYRLWRGFWSDADKNRDSERSRLIAPALQQAIEMTVSEQEAAAFDRDNWIDVKDDMDDQEKQDAEVICGHLLEDFDWANVKKAVAETFLNGALYGTGIAKVRVGKGDVLSAETDDYGTTESTSESRIKVFVEAVHPLNFVIDPAAKVIDEALGCAHEMVVPMHRINQGQMSGRYYKVQVGEWSGEDLTISEMGLLSQARDIDHTDSVYITEYHGLVPKKFLDPNYKPDSDDEDLVIKGEDDEPIVEEGELVEAIVTIANKSMLLKERESPYLYKDRCIVSYQHETVPNQFWGRGVAEKGYNPQKALDGELRARMDALGLLTYPVMGADATRLPRGLDLRLRPGKMFLVNGRPSEILEPISFGNLDPSTFQNSSDLERMVQMGTGAMDSAVSSSEQRRNETVGGMSMLQSGFLKRAKRTMGNVERQFLQPMVNKALWRYMQFMPERYPYDPDLVVKGTMGIMAREVEQQNLTQMLQVIPPESPIFNIIVKGIIQNSVGPSRGELTAAIEQSMQPDPKQQAMQEQMQQIQFENAQLQNMELKAKAVKAIADAELARAKAEHEGVKASLEDDKVDILAAQTVVSHQKNQTEILRMHHEADQNAQDRQHEKETGMMDKAHASFEGDKNRLDAHVQSGTDQQHQAKESNRERKHTAAESGRDRTHTSGEASKERRHASVEASKERDFGSKEAQRDRKAQANEGKQERDTKVKIAKSKPRPKVSK